MKLRLILCVFKKIKTKQFVSRKGVNVENSLEEMFKKNFNQLYSNNHFKKLAQLSLNIATLGHRISCYRNAQNIAISSGPIFNAFFPNFLFIWLLVSRPTSIHVYSLLLVRNVIGGINHDIVAGLCSELLMKLSI